MATSKYWLGVGLVFMLASGAMAGVDAGVFEPWAPGSLSAPMGLDLERPGINGESPELVLIPQGIPRTPAPAAPAKPLAGFMLAATLIAAVLRLVVTVLRSGVASAVWMKLPWVAQWAILGGSVAALAALDSYLRDGDWGMALSDAAAGLFASWSTQKIQKNAALVAGVPQ